MRAMIFAAGLGTRFKPWTNNHPKALALVNGKSLLQRNVEYLQGFGIREVIVNVHHFSGQIQSAIRAADGWGSQLEISDETLEVLDTGGGLKKAAWYFGEHPFVVMNVDILTDLDLNAMIRFHQEKRPLATLAVKDRKSSRYFLFDGAHALCGWRNIKTGEEKLARPQAVMEQRAFSGIQIIEPDIFAVLQQEGKFSIVESYLQLARNYQILSFDQGVTKLIDVGKPEAVPIAESLFP